MRLRTLAIALAAGAAAPHAFAQEDAPHPGKAVYDASCASCHNDPLNTPGAERAAPLSVLRNTSSTELRASLTGDGIMAPMAAALSGEQLDQLVTWLTAEQKAATVEWDQALLCEADNRTVNVSAANGMTYFGADLKSTRSLSAADAGLTASDLANLEIDYAIGIPRTQSLGIGVASLGDTAFVNSGGKLLALDADEGCARWIYDGGGSRTTPTIAEINGKTALVYVTGRGDINAVDAATGQQIWKATGLPENGVGSVRGGVIVHNDKVIVPISASGVASGMNPTFECCEGHGAVVALSAADGSRLWEYHTMEDAEYNGLVSPTGVKQKGPSGAPIWAMPTIDEKRNAVIVTTGENTSMPATETSDAVISIDLDTGEQNWLFQAMELDVWNMSCRSTDADSGPNCPWQFDEANIGRDFDFGGAAILVRTKGGLFGIGARDILLAGQKSGHIWALDANNGEVIWSDRVGVGSPLGGNHWGIAADPETQIVYQVIADSIPSPEGEAVPGVYAYRINDGKKLWEYRAQADCDGARGETIVNCETKFGFSSTPLIVDGVLLAATLDGKLFAFDGKTGDIKAEIDLAIPLETKNGVEARGGSIDAHGVSAGAGRVFISSGYGSFSQTPGNAVIALGPK